MTLKAMYNILIKGGRVIDPEQKIDDKLDIGINGSKISALAKDIPPLKSYKVIDATGKIVTPGLIDMHCHVYAGIHDGSVDPDEAGVMQGITTVVDAGSSGQAIFEGFPKYVIPLSRTNIFCFLSIASQGHTLRPELRDWAEINANATIDKIRSNRNIIKGLKLRLVGNLAVSDGIKVWRVTKSVAEKVDLPVMIHTPDTFKQTPLKLTQEIIALMEPGDILSHIYSPMHGGCLSLDGTFYPEIKDAVRRGVVLDVAGVAGHGTHFSYSIAQKGIAEGIFPTTLSTDLVKGRSGNFISSLAGVMSVFLALGLDLKSIIKMVTINPARVLCAEKRIGCLKPGLDADISIMEMKTGSWEVPDVDNQTKKINKLLTPSYCIKSGQFIEAKPMAMPKSV